tara:strand:- start:798 stop:1529 length:732 start_codon:yes stop_codon:yes gene_type:complete
MNILNEVVKGASRQFGREFGRAGANAILKGKNYYTVQGGGDYTGRIKQSDSNVVRAIKVVLKVKFVTTNKANISRLIDLTDLATDALSFNGVETLNEIQDIKVLIEEYNDKFEHGSVLVDDNYEDKSLDFLKAKRNEFVDLLSQFNADIKSFVKTKLDEAVKNKKNKKTATWLSCPFLIVGCFGFHKFYVNHNGHGILYILTFGWLSPFLSLVNFIQFIKMNQEKFDEKYNPEFSFYSQFKFD